MEPHVEKKDFAQINIVVADIETAAEKWAARWASIPAAAGPS